MIKDFSPDTGQAFQGDVSIVPIPADIAIATTQEIKPIDGRLILQEGEATGHHHAIVLRQRKFRDDTRVAGDPLMSVPARLRKTFGGGAKKAAAVPTARMYRDDTAAQEMLRRGILTRTDLVVACLVVENGPMVITHEEHDGIRVPPGSYLIGRQVESAGAEERVVAD